ncbi:hypothetical protein ES702_01850 [subsurface metagenome]
MSLNDAEDKTLKAECTRLIQFKDGKCKCLVMIGPPPLIAEMFETWDESYRAYCERCLRFSHNRAHAHILEERERLWLARTRKEYTALKEWW